MEFNYFFNLLKVEADKAHGEWLDTDEKNGSVEEARLFERWQMYLRLAQLASEAIMDAEADALRSQLTQARQ